MVVAHRGLAAVGQAMLRMLWLRRALLVRY
ncbi:hypothetical protein CsSME_00019059 [Camellia sinensis var. sinensis]